MISIYSRKILRFLIFLLVGLTLANLTVQIARFSSGRNNLLGITRLFDVNNENNIPTWYATITLLLCSLLLWLISSIKSHHKDQYARYWKGLSLLFLFLSLDEAASFHELLIPFGSTVQASGFLFFIWVIPGIIFALIVALIYFKFLMALPAQTRYLFVAAGVIYISGSVGFEMLGGYYFDMHIKENVDAYATGLPALSMAMILAIEEFLEMLGILVFLYALMSYINLNLREVQVSFSKSKTEQLFAEKLVYPEENPDLD
jgi:hypothetical protein